MRISDDGKGFDKAQITHRGGLINMKMRAEEIYAELKISSIVGFGTQLLLGLPIKLNLFPSSFSP